MQLKHRAFHMMKPMEVIIVLAVIILFLISSGKANANEQEKSLTHSLPSLKKAPNGVNEDRVWFNGKRRVNIPSERLRNLEPSLVVTLQGRDSTDTVSALTKLGYPVEATRVRDVYLIYLQPIKASTGFSGTAQDVLELSLQLEHVQGIERIELNHRLGLGYR